MRARKLTAVVCILAVLVSVCALPVNAEDLGGWSETRGYFTNAALTRASDKPDQHFGEKMTRSVPAGTQFQAHGWTKWEGMWHYTTARMEIRGGGVLKTSDRQWRTSFSEAYSGWWQWTDGVNAIACTYWGNQP